MRLIELSPRWFTFQQPAPEDAGKHWYIGLTFECPHCRKERLAIQFEPEIDEGFGWKFRHWDSYIELRKQHLWHRDGETFDTLTLTPSIDGSGAGHWHGWIRNGEVF